MTPQEKNKSDGRVPAIAARGIVAYGSDGLVSHFRSKEIIFCCENASIPVRTVKDLSNAKEITNTLVLVARVPIIAASNGLVRPK